MADVSRMEVDGIAFPLTDKENRKSINQKYYASHKDKHPQKSVFCFKISVNRADQDRLDKMKSIISVIKKKLTGNRRTPSDINALLMEELLKSYIKQNNTNESDVDIEDIEDDPIIPPTLLPPELLTANKFQLHTHSTRDDELHIVTNNSLTKLFTYFLSGNGKQCRCGRALDINTLKVERITTNNHCCKASLSCSAKHIVEWFSSPIVNGRYYANLRMVHGFTSSGLLQSQYENLCKAANLGFLNEHYVTSVYENMQYIQSVEDMTKYQFVVAQEDIKEEEQYNEDGAGLMLDARHDSVRTAYHTTVTGISMTSHKVVGVVNCSSEEVKSAAAREKPMCLELVDSLVNEDNLNITEVSHDTVISVKNQLEERGIENSFDTWHGGKGVKRAVTTVAKGTMKTEGKIWFLELSDKVKSIKTHSYYAMKNCGGDAGNLRKQLLNIVKHYQNDHEECNQESRCKTQADYIPTKRIITVPAAVAALKKAIMSTSIYRNAEDFASCRDTYYVESFHNVILIYAPKRIHFSDPVYNMRINLAIMDWNENVDREIYCERHYQSVKRPDRVAPYRVLKPKTFFFKDSVWATFYALN